MGWTPTNGTDIANMDNGIEETANERRGYAFVAVNDGSVSWSDIKAEIDAVPARPALFGIAHEDYGYDPLEGNHHAVTLIGYEEISGGGVSTVTLEASADTFVESKDKNKNWGSKDSFYVGKWYDGTDYVALIKFDLSALPTDSFLSSAELQLYCSFDAMGSGDYVCISPADRTWSESAVTWNTKPLPDSSAETLHGHQGSTTWTMNVKNHVKEWLSGAKSNHGFYVRYGGTTTNRFAFFNSRETTNQNYRPKLVVTAGADRIVIVHDNWYPEDDVYLNFDACFEDYNSTTLTKVTPGGQQTWLLTVQTTPDTGAPITVSPADNSGQGNGTTNFTRTYDADTVVSLTAPETHSGKNFVKWTKNGAHYSTNRTITVTMDADHTLQALYELSQPPLPPTGVSATDGTYTDKVRVTWTASATATGYEVWRHTSNSSGAATNIGSSSGTTYDDTTAAQGTTYWYWVKATSAAGTSGFSGSDSGYCKAAVPPSVSITEPASGAILAAGSNITVHATASDTDGSVTKVEFYCDGTKLGEDTTSPYQCPWTNVPVGIYMLTAKATDNDGATKVSDPVMVEVRVPGDANGDGKVDSIDVAIVRMHWNPTGTNAKWEDGDFNGDGKVDSLDVAL
ncbi:MAG TPA: DNRLRE domain-containing protein, partial [Phycisphaerae bacterium]|nr:DNRLRE domain-containing protein [Phycisphaerae bacterium]